MSARAVRRAFASPFVVTLAAALPVAACYVQPAGPQAPSGGGERVHTNPPRPTPIGPQVPPPETHDHSTTTAGAEQPAPGGTTVVANPPRPTVAKTDRLWLVSNNQGTCSAMESLPPCEKGSATVPAPPCNPPPPIPATPYTCSAAIPVGKMVNVVQFAGHNFCQIAPEPMKCPPNAKCNPPPPRRVTCPQ